MPAFKIGQIGQGRWGKMLNRYFAGHPGFEVKKFGGRQVVNAVIADPEIQAVVLATPLKTLHPLAKRVLESGKHLFIEKPAAQTSAEVFELQTIAQGRGLKVLVDYTFTFSAAIAQMRLLIEQGEIGEVFAVNLSMLQWGEFKGMSVYSELGCHMLSVLNLLVPLHELDFQHRHYYMRSGIVETGALLFKARSNHLQGHILVSLNSANKERIITVYGEKGSITYHMLSETPLQMLRYEAEAVNYPHFTEGDNLKFAVDCFHQMLCGRKPSNLADAIAITKVLEQIT